MSAARQENLLPLGLAKGCVLRRDVPSGRAIGFDDLDTVPDTPLWQMRKLQDRLCV